jgi:hypothetical protein
MPQGVTQGVEWPSHVVPIDHLFQLDVNIIFHEDMYLMVHHV